ncbi:MAG TPA: myo-inosose-2 dehydratase [Bdellovibrionales bacterium]|nr:myo-inosose-2 dehydratase [Bdellovibrionales bacterium]
MLKVKVAAQPIIWSNDDFHDLGGNTPLEQCLKEMRQAGYEGTELGHKMPKNAELLLPLLKENGLQLVSGWHSTYLASRSFQDETTDFKAHMKFLKDMGCKVVIAAECTNRVYHTPGKALDWEFAQSPFDESEWKKITTGLDEFAKMAEGQGMKLVYHHHMGTGIQNLRQIERLMENTKHLWLLGDTGHLAFAGENPAEVFETYKSRIGHVHLKNVRPDIVRTARFNHWSFDKAVREGVFTVPGDGGLDFKPIFQIMDGVNYEGWFVVEAEQDPVKANPLEYAKKGRAYIQQTAGV